MFILTNDLELFETNCITIGVGGQAITFKDKEGIQQTFSTSQIKQITKENISETNTLSDEYVNSDF